MSGCIFCKIIEGAIPCHRVAETSRVLAFMDINPLSKGHVLIIPKTHAEFLHEVDPEVAGEMGTLLAKISRIVAGPANASPVAYNILQNNGRLAHQEVPHVHFHIIPKRTEEEGLGVRWNSMPTDHTLFAEEAKKYREALEKL